MSRRSIAFIDHYDSFSLNLVAWLKGGAIDVDIEVIEFDREMAINRLIDQMKPIVFSPGPKAPKQALASMRILNKSLGVVPVLGVCLGHQMLCEAWGGTIVESKYPLHGLCREIISRDNSYEIGLPRKFKAAAYNSLEVASESLEESLCLAKCTQGTIQAVGKYLGSKHPAIGVQFHPESFLTDDLSAMRDMWLSHA